MKIYNKIKLEKIFKRIIKKFKNPKDKYNPFFQHLNNIMGYTNFYSAIEPEAMVEKIRKYLKGFNKYKIDINCRDSLYFVEMYVYGPNYNDKLFINYINNDVVKEIGDGFIYKHNITGAKPYYIYISNFNLVRISRERKILAFFCKGFSYEKVNSIYKKYTGRGISETTYLKYNLG